SISATAYPDLDIAIVVIVSGRGRPAAVAARHPPASLQGVVEPRLAPSGSDHRLVHVAHQIVDAERADALARGVVALAEIFERQSPTSCARVQIRSVLVALGLAAQAVGVRQHLFALAGEVPLVLETQAPAHGRAALLGQREALVIDRHAIGTGRFEAVDAKAKFRAFAQTLGLPGVASAAGERQRFVVEPLEAVVLDLRT